MDGLVESGSHPQDNPTGIAKLRRDARAGANLEIVRTRVDRGSLRRHLDGNLAVIGTQEPTLDQIPHEYLFLLCVTSHRGGF